MKIDLIKREIENIDFEILKLINDRMEKRLIFKKITDQDSNEDNELCIEKNMKEYIETSKTRYSQLIDPDFCEKVVNDIISEAKEIGQKELKLLAFQGEHGAYSEVAAKKWDKSLVTIPCKEFSDVFNGVSKGIYDYGIVPVENTLGGVVGQVNNLLTSTNTSIVGAIEIPINHCLLIVPEANHREIRTVYSHPQALSQCREFLKRNKLEPTPYYDTAGAAQMLFKNRQKTFAAIASELAAELYNLEIIKQDIQDLNSNRTRFLIISRNENKILGNKCSIIFSTEHRSGTLFNVLQIFAKEEINLTRIESFPNEPGVFTFFLDFLGSIEDERVITAVKNLEKITTKLKVLGCYEEKIV